MQMNEIIALVIGGIVLIITAVYLVVNQKNKVIEWLKYAVSEAEKMLGSGTGQLKLRLVYDWFCDKFPIAAAILPFRVFSAWVDTALDTMKEWLGNNKNVAGYIGVTAMGIYTNEGLVKHAEKALALNTKYMWGGILRPIEQQYDMLFKMYGNKAGTGYSTARWNELSQLRNKGYYGVDCVGLVKSYYWSGKADGGTGSPKYGTAGFPDVNANYMYQLAKVKGKIADMPEIPGLIVYSKSHPHVGIYIGNGYTIESTLGARGDGVVKRKLDSFWEYWFQCPYIEYPKTSQASSGTKTYKLVYPAGRSQGSVEQQQAS